jgi:hypothetical protein
MGKDHRAKKTPAQYKKLANLLGQNMPVSEAMVKAGWSEQQAAKGWKKVPQGVVRMLPKSAQRLMHLGKTTPAEDMRALVHGRLIDNVTRGSDKGAQSAKILGSSRDLNLWTPDQLAGVIILQAPQWAIDHKKELLADSPKEKTYDGESLRLRPWLANGGNE